MFTDPQRMRKSDTGRPDLCNVFTFHKLYSPEASVLQIADACRTACIGCTDCKGQLASRLAVSLKPVHERQDYYMAHPEEVLEILRDGEAKAREIARATMAEVRDALKI